MHFADLHLDHVLSEYGPAARRQRRAELLQCFDFIVDKALSSGVSILLVAGDLLCARSVSSSTLEAVKRGFARLGEAGVFVALVPGEAEEPDGLEALREVASGNNVHLFMGDEWSRVEPIPGVSLWGLRTTGRNASISVLAGLRVDGPGIHIGLMHATTEGQGPDGRGLSTVTGADLAASGLHYLALGHYHSVLNCSVGPPRAGIRGRRPTTISPPEVSATCSRSRLATARLRYRGSRYRRAPTAWWWWTFRESPPTTCDDAWRTSPTSSSACGRCWRESCQRAWHGCLRGWSGSSRRASFTLTL